MVFSNFPDLFQAMVSGNDLCHFVLNRVLKPSKVMWLLKDFQQGCLSSEA